jgi:hypothetical protein
VPSNLLGLFTIHQTTTQVKKIIWDILPTPSRSATKVVYGKTKRRAKCGDMSKHMHWETGVDAKQTRAALFFPIFLILVYLFGV